METIEDKYPLKNETYKIIGVCQEVHKVLGKGFAEIVYKDALEYEFQISKIFFEREKEYLVKYKDIILPHRFYADFVVFGKIILEVKSQKILLEENVGQVLNYLKVSNCQVGLLINFGEFSLKTKRVIL